MISKVVERFIDRHGTLYGILSVPLTALVFAAVVVATMWIAHFLPYLRWMLPS